MAVDPNSQPVTRQLNRLRCRRARARWRGGGCPDQDRGQESGSTTLHKLLKTSLRGQRAQFVSPRDWSNTRPAAIAILSALGPDRISRDHPPKTALLISWALLFCSYALPFGNWQKAAAIQSQVRRGHHRRLDDPVGRHRGRFPDVYAHQPELELAFLTPGGRLAGVAE